MSVRVSLGQHGKVISDRSNSGRVKIYSAGSDSTSGVLEQV